MGSGGLEFASTRVVLVLSLYLAAGGFAGDAPAMPSGGARKGWEQLNLSATTFAGVTVYYEKALEPNLPAFERELLKFREGRARLGNLLGRRREILADINHIVGMTDPNLAKQDKLLGQFAGMYGDMEITFYLVRAATAKDFLRAGGQLPNTTYDRQNDTATYDPRIRVRPGEKAPRNWDLCLPISRDKEFSEFVGKIFTMLGYMFGWLTADVAIHEVTEMTLVERMRPADPYFRWFSDGFANAITCLLVAKYVDAAAAQEFAAAYDVGKYRHLEKELNLRYWMATNSCIYFERMPVKAESELEHARYAYALVEARAILDQHGIDCVRRIAEAFRARESRQGADLLEVIGETIGEDTEQRLARYQTFATREEGLARYERSLTFTDSGSEKDCEAAFVSLMRYMELRGERFSSNHLKNTVFAALLLARMGHAEIADGTMQACVERYSKSTAPDDRLAALEALVTYTVGSKRPRVAQEAADELLRRDPAHVGALTAKMLGALQDKNLPRARDYARQIRQQAPDTSSPYKMASQILALDPNRPPSTTGAGKPN